MRKCPCCGSEYSGYPALSRRDNTTEICPRCGMIEAVNCMLANKIEDVKVYTAYSQEADITFIMEYKGKTTRVVGFYYGEPNEEDTERYYGSLIAVLE